MDFHKFPYDIQELPIRRILLKDSRSSVRFKTFADPATLNYTTWADAPGWDTIGVTVKPSRGHLMLDLSGKTVEESGLTKEEMQDLGYDPEGLELANDHMEVILTVKRKASFYERNICYPVMFLTLTACLSFALRPAQLGTRVGMCVTLILAMYTFQSVASEYIPPTSYQTAYHQFVLFSIVIVMLITVESVAVYKLPQWIIDTDFLDNKSIDEKSCKGRIS